MLTEEEKKTSLLCYWEYYLILGNILLPYTLNFSLTRYIMSGIN